MGFIAPRTTSAGKTPALNQGLETNGVFHTFTDRGQIELFPLPL